MIKYYKSDLDNEDEHFNTNRPLSNGEKAALIAAFFLVIIIYYVQYYL